VLGPTADGVDFALIRMDGSIATVRAGGDGLTWLNTATLPSQARLAGIADWLPESGPELFVATSGGAVWVLDCRLEPLARLGDRALTPADDGVHVLDGGELPSFLVAASIQTGLGRRFVLEPNPRPIPWGALAGTLGSGGVITVLVRRRRFRPSRATSRELRLQLLERLMLSGHGAIGGLSSLRRLLWNLDTLNQGYAMNDARRRDLLGLAHDIAATQLPNLEAALELANLAKPGDKIAARASDTLADLKRLVGRVVAGGLERTDPALLAELQDAGARAEQSFQALRRDVEAVFLAEPAKIVAQALEAHGEALATGCVAVSAGLQGWPPCRMDPEELAFVVDNLVENAVRALEGSPDPRLDIDGEVCGRHFTIRVRDTGYGVAPDDWERIFEEGGSSREGGGLGLPRSRQLLRKHGGRVMVAESNPGGGTIMALTLPVNASASGDDPAAGAATASSLRSSP
jgi:signal transduction histidine kinase